MFYGFLPILIHFLFSSSPWLQFEYKGFGWSECLFATWRKKELHLATISEPNPGFVEVAHQYRCFRVPLIQHAIILHPCSLLALSSFLVMDLATCQMSKKCFVLAQDSRIHFAIPLWRSEIKTATVKPSCFKKAKHLLHPSSSVCWLPPVSFA